MCRIRSAHVLFPGSATAPWCLHPLRLFNKAGTCVCSTQFGACPVPRAAHQHHQGRVGARMQIVWGSTTVMLSAGRAAEEPRTQNARGRFRPKDDSDAWQEDPPPEQDSEEEGLLLGEGLCVRATRGRARALQFSPHSPSSSNTCRLRWQGRPSRPTRSARAGPHAAGPGMSRLG